MNFERSESNLTASTFDERLEKTLARETLHTADTKHGGQSTISSRRIGKYRWPDVGNNSRDRKQLSLNTRAVSIHAAETQLGEMSHFTDHVALETRR